MWKTGHGAGPLAVLGPAERWQEGIFPEHVVGADFAEHVEGNAAVYLHELRKREGQFHRQNGIRQGKS